MLTPQEVSERAFSKASFGGYNMSQVDEFLDVLTGDYSTLYSENAVLKSKMKVLVDKVEEYRSTEEAMRKALMTAQRMADELVKEAEQKKAQIIADAEAEAVRRKEELSQQLEAEEYRLQTAQQATAVFVEQVRALQADQTQLLDRLQDLCPAPAPAADPGDQAAENLKAKQEEEAAQEDLEDTAEFAPVDWKSEEEEQPEEDVEEEEAPIRSSRIDFGELQFGRDYEIK